MVGKPEQQVWSTEPWAWAAIIFPWLIQYSGLALVVLGEGTSCLTLLLPQNGSGLLCDSLSWNESKPWILCDSLWHLGDSDSLCAWGCSSPGCDFVNVTIQVDLGLVSSNDGLPEGKPRWHWKWCHFIISSEMGIITSVFFKLRWPWSFRRQLAI